MILVLSISLWELHHHLLAVRIVLNLVVLLLSVVICYFFEAARFRRDSGLVLAPLLEKLPYYVLIYCGSAISGIFCKAKAIRWF